jgi:hypothetical protein
LWRNGRYWWIAFTLIHEGWRQERVRRSLETEDVLEARARRNLLLAALAARGEPALSLRLSGARREAGTRAWFTPGAHAPAALVAQAADSGA